MRKIGFSERKNSPDPVYGLYFSDIHEGWALTLKGILHTNNGGCSWERLLECDRAIANLFILDKNRLMVSTTLPDGVYLYSSRDRGASWEKVNITPDEAKELDDVENRLGGKSLHYGGIYSYEAYFPHIAR